MLHIKYIDDTSLRLWGYHVGIGGVYPPYDWNGTGPFVTYGVSQLFKVRRNGELDILVGMNFWRNGTFCHCANFWRICVPDAVQDIFSFSLFVNLLCEEFLSKKYFL